MPTYIITEHHRRRIKEKWVIETDNPEDALRKSTNPPFKPLAHACWWPYIEDGLGGGALIDPADPDHCIRADPRPEGFFQVDSTQLDEER